MSSKKSNKKSGRNLKLSFNEKDFVQVGNRIIRKASIDDECWIQCCPACCCLDYVPCSCPCYWPADQALPPRSNECWWGMPEADAWYPGSYFDPGELPDCPYNNLPTRGGTWNVPGPATMSGFTHSIWGDGRSKPMTAQVVQCGGSVYSVGLRSRFSYENRRCNDPPWPGPPVTGDYLGNWVVVVSQCRFLIPIKSCGWENAYGQRGPRYDPYEYNTWGCGDCNGVISNNLGCPTHSASVCPGGLGSWHLGNPGCCAYGHFCGTGSCCDNLTGFKEETGYLNDPQPAWNDATMDLTYTISGAFDDHKPGCCGGFVGTETSDPYNPECATQVRWDDRDAQYP